jgi:hypothetical protein
LLLKRFLMGFDWCLGYMDIAPRTDRCAHDQRALS